MRKMCVFGLFVLAVSTGVLGGVLPIGAGRGKPDPAITFYRGTVTEVNPSSWSLTIKTDEGAVYTFRVARYAELAAVAVGDRVQAEAITNWGIVLSVRKIPLPPQAGH